MASTMLTINVQTYAGQQLVSRQLADRGLAEDTIVGDLMAQIATQIDYQMLNQATYGALATAQGTTYTDASPTPDKLLPYIYQSESLLEKALLGRARPNYVVMRSEHWNWICGTVSASHPWAAENSAQQAGVVLMNNEYGMVRGRLANGLQVITDNNIPSGTPAILVVASPEIHVWEDPGAPILIRAEQPSAANLGILLVAFEYAAFTFKRYSNNPGSITGSGVALPSGF